MRVLVGVLRGWSLGLAAAAALALTGCGGGETKTVVVTSGATGESAAPAPAPAGGGGSDGGSGSVDAGSPLVKKTVRALDSKDGTVEIAVLDLKVEDRLMRLTASFAPKFPSETPDESISLYDMNGGSPLYVTLVDPIGLKRYVVVEDSEGRALAPDVVSTAAANGAAVTATWTFAAPPADVPKIDVQVGEWPPFSDVEIQR